MSCTSQASILPVFDHANYKLFVFCQPKLQVVAFVHRNEGGVYCIPQLMHLSIVLNWLLF